MKQKRCLSDIPNKISKYTNFEYTNFLFQEAKFHSRGYSDHFCIYIDDIIFKSWAMNTFSILLFIIKHFCLQNIKLKRYRIEFLIFLSEKISASRCLVYKDQIGNPTDEKKSCKSKNFEHPHDIIIFSILMQKRTIQVGQWFLLYKSKFLHRNTVYKVLKSIKSSGLKKTPPFKI